MGGWPLGCRGKVMRQLLRDWGQAAVNLQCAHRIWSSAMEFCLRTVMFKSYILAVSQVINQLINQSMQSRVAILQASSQSM